MEIVMSKRTLSKDGLNDPSSQHMSLTELSQQDDDYEETNDFEPGTEKGIEQSTIVNQNGEYRYAYSGQKHLSHRRLTNLANNNSNT